MTRRPLLVAALLSFALAAGLGACGGDDGDDGTEVTTETSTPGEKTDGTAVSLKARLSGAEEVPGPGVQTGVGAFTLDITAKQGCYQLNVTMGEQPTAAHIHRGAAGASGPVVMNLSPAFRAGESGFLAEGCVGPVPDDALAGLIADPAAYYVNVHSQEYPDGAMRGQLEKV